MCLNRCHFLDLMLLIKNARVWTGLGSPFAGSVLCEKGLIVRVDAGDLDVDGPCEVIDARGGAVIPAMTDCHCHVHGAARMCAGVDLFDCRSKAEALARLIEYARTKGQDEWIVGNRANENLWDEKELPTRYDLDVIPQPVVIRRICVHVHCVNSRAIELIGEEKFEGLEGVVRDEKGKMNGVLKEGSCQPISSAMADVSCEMEVENLLREYSSYGVGEVHVVGINQSFMNENISVYQKLREKGQLPVRVVFYIDTPPSKEFHFSSGFGDDWLRYGGLKIFIDGSLGGRTAALREPYCDGSGNGSLIHSDTELYHIIKEAFERDLQLMAHVIGDRGIDQILDVIERIYSEGIVPKWPVKLTHVEVCHPEQIERIARLGIHCDMQPNQMVYDATNLGPVIGEERLSMTFAFKSMLEAGINVTGSSDAPIEPINPMTGIRGCVLRAPGMKPEEKITLEQALTMYTHNAQKLILRHERKGILAPGQLADITVFEDDIFSVDSENLLKCKVLATIVDGKVVYRSEKSF